MWIVRVGGDDKSGLGLKSMPYPMEQHDSLLGAYYDMRERIARDGNTRVVLVAEKIGDEKAHD